MCPYHLSHWQSLRDFSRLSHSACIMAMFTSNLFQNWTPLLDVGWSSKVSCMWGRDLWHPTVDVTVQLFKCFICLVYLSQNVAEPIIFITGQPPWDSNVEKIIIWMSIVSPPLIVIDWLRDWSMNDPLMPLGKKKAHIFLTRFLGLWLKTGEVPIRESGECEA